MREGAQSREPRCERVGRAESGVLALRSRRTGTVGRGTFCDRSAFCEIISEGGGERRALIISPLVLLCSHVPAKQAHQSWGRMRSVRVSSTFRMRSLALMDDFRLR